MAVEIGQTALGDSAPLTVYPFPSFRQKVLSLMGQSHRFTFVINLMTS